MLFEEEFLKDLDNEITDKEVEELGIDLDKEGYEITNEGQADFFLRKIAELEEENASINTVCDKKIESYNEKVNEFRNNNLKKNNNTIDYFTRLLQAYADKVIAENPKKKSVKLPFGTLQYKKTAANFKYDDEKALIEFLNTADLKQYINITQKEALKKADLKKVLIHKEDGVYLGEVKLPHAEYVPEDKKFSVKIK